MSSLFGFNVDGFSLIIPDGISDVSDIDKCDIRISFSRDSDESLEVNTEPPSNCAEGNVVSTVLDVGEDNSIGDVSAGASAVDDGDWMYSSVSLPVGTMLYIKNGKYDVLATAIIANKCIRILAASKMPDAVGQEFRSPNAAAAAVTGYKAANGWNFWQVEKKRASGRVSYVRLSSLRKKR